MNTIITSTTARTITRTTAAAQAAQTTFVAAPQAPATIATHRSRCAAGLASVLVTCSLLASVVGGFGSQADEAQQLAQQAPVSLGALG